MTSREEFMRQMGITGDDVVDPLKKGCKPVKDRAERAGPRDSVRTPPVVDDVPVPMGRGNSRRQSRDDLMASLGGDGDRAPAPGPAPGRDRAAFMREIGIESDAPEAPVRRSPAAAPAAASDRMAFLRSLNIDNAGLDAAATAAAPEAREARVRPVASSQRQQQPTRDGLARGPGADSAEPRPAPVRAAAAAAAPSAGSRAAFLREMGIDNAGQAPSAPDAAKAAAPAAARDGAAPQPRNATGSQEYPRGAAAEAAAPGLSRRDSTRSALRALRDGDDDAAGPALEPSREGIYLGRRGSTQPAPANGGLEAELLGLKEDASPEEIKNMGNKFFQGGDYRKAVRLYSKAIERDVNNAALYSNRSAAYLLGTKQMGIDTRTMALRDADKVIKLQPGWFKGYSRRGDALFKLERFDDAVAAYRRALDIDPDNSCVAHSLGECERYSKPKLTSSTKQSWTVSSAPECPKSALDFRAPAGDKTAYDLLSELQERRERETPEMALRGNDWRARELEKFRGRGSSEYDCAPPPPPTFGDEPTTKPALDRAQIPEEFNSDAAACYQASLLESFRKKKAMRTY